MFSVVIRVSSFPSVQIYKLICIITCFLNDFCSVNEKRGNNLIQLLPLF
ncbi:hypothetical protein BACCELL_04183 [Bacteroides cellulosilyticus DSM 14838]|uniref:Uncharacterized protein n=1 Tax=Bacteroides cellulosilyticus DSM 14838 TaxID=537012 RepID=E2NIQ1_9BACE|nr:hypothetical protein BACCELL_04183 [Bacteroides cellulosilyticus DSM 14838]